MSLKFVPSKMQNKQEGNGLINLRRQGHLKLISRPVYLTRQFSKFLVSRRYPDRICNWKIYGILIVIALLQVISINHESQFSTYIDLIQLYRRRPYLAYVDIASGTFRYAVAQPPYRQISKIAKQPPNGLGGQNWCCRWNWWPQFTMWPSFKVSLLVKKWLYCHTKQDPLTCSTQVTTYTTDIIVIYHY